MVGAEVRRRLGSSRVGLAGENEGFASDASEFVVKIHETSETTFVVNAVEVTSGRMVDLVGASPARKLTITDVASKTTHSNLTLVAKEPLDGGKSVSPDQWGLLK